jgi:hypothetical protein
MNQGSPGADSREDSAASERDDSGEGADAGITPVPGTKNVQHLASKP